MDKQQMDALQGKLWDIIYAQEESNNRKYPPEYAAALAGLLIFGELERIERNTSKALDRD